MTKLVGGWKLTGIQIPVKALIISRLVFFLELFILFIASCYHSKSGTIFMTIVTIIHTGIETHRFLVCLKNSQEFSSLHMSEVLLNNLIEPDPLLSINEPSFDIFESPNVERSNVERSNVERSNVVRSSDVTESTSLFDELNNVPPEYVYSV